MCTFCDLQSISHCLTYKWVCHFAHHYFTICVFPFSSFMHVHYISLVILSWVSNFQWSSMLENYEKLKSLNTSSSLILSRSFTFIQPIMLHNSNFFHLMILHCGIFYLHSFESQLIIIWQQCHVFKIVFTSCSNSTHPTPPNL
jgi:hypothetical protein